MRSTIPYTIIQVPEPGLFSGDTSEMELFCQLSGDTFKTYPCKLWPSDAKINFVQSRLRGAARSWFQTKYPICNNRLDCLFITHNRFVKK